MTEQQGARFCAAVARSLPLLLAGLLLGSCYSPRPVAPLMKDELTLSAKEQAGERVFFRRCHECHPHGTAGVGIAIAGYPESVVEAQVRLGAGAMPDFDEERISDEELDAVAAYVEALGRADE